MKIGVPKETADGERRVALVPDAVRSLSKREGVEIVVESGAGEAAGHPDDQYSDAGATVAGRPDALSGDVVLSVAVPSAGQIGELKSGQVLITHLAPWTSAETNNALATAGVTAFAMEAIPRTTRAQAMDALSSQATAAGYSATMIASRESGRFWGMLTTAAGTIRPAKVLVLGAGVAGLQAIATAKRLGAIVTGFDIRRAAWEQIGSLGGRPLELDFIPDAEGEGGYARPLTEEENEQVRQALAENAARQDVIITTAAIPGRPAPTLITADAVANMAPGSVIVDLAAETGGNCELTEVGQTVESGGVKIVGPRNLPSDLPSHASQLYAKNLENLLGLMITDEGTLDLNFEDDIIDAACIAHDGEVRGEEDGEVVDLVTEITILVLAAFVGFEVISKVPATLHTPLMSQTNAIHGIVLLGGLIVVGFADSTLDEVIGFVAIVFGTVNIVGGFMVTDRMLEMFGTKKKKKPEPEAAPAAAEAGSSADGEEGSAK